MRVYLIVFLLLCSAVCPAQVRDAALIEKHLSSAADIISRYGVQYDSEKQLRAVYEGNWITIRYLTNNHKVSDRFTAFQFDQKTIIQEPIPLSNGFRLFVVMAVLNVDGQENDEVKEYKFLIRDPKASDTLFEDFTQLKKLQR